jgi:hypothetical protein
MHARDGRWLVGSVAPLVVVAPLAFVACGSAQASSAATSDAGTGDATTPDADPWQGVVADTMSGCVLGFQVPVHVGAQTFQLFIDTGSATTAIASASCADCADAGATTTYSPSPSATDTHAPAKANYGTATDPSWWSGEVYTDTVQPGGAPVSVPVNLVAIDQESRFLGPLTCGGHRGDGILGLGPAIGLIGKTDSVLDKLVASGMPDVFAVQLCDVGGHLWLGGFDRTAGTSEPIYTPLLPTSATAPHYAVTFTDMQLGGKPLAVPSASFGPAILDTGAAGLSLPSDVYAALTSTLEGLPQFTAIFPGTLFGPTGTCYAQGTTTLAKLDAALPALTIGLGGGGSITVPASRSYIVPTKVRGEPFYCAGILDGGGLAGITGGKFLVGFAGLRGNVTIFDRATQRVGFMPFASCP